MTTLDNEIKTFTDLYIFLQNYTENIISWLENPWKGKDKQESLLRLFAHLGLINKFKDYNICVGNFNKKTIRKRKEMKETFYNLDQPICLNDRGDSSDLTFVSKKDDKHLLITTSKNLNKLNIGKLDIDKIVTNFQQYKQNNYTMSLCICIRSKEDYFVMKQNVESTSKELQIFLDKEDTIVIDWKDLKQAYFQFKKIYCNRKLDTILKSDKVPLCLKMHQELSVIKTMKMKKKILWGHVQRSGKSYIIGGCVEEDSKNKKECNYLIITTAIKETDQQYHEVFNYLQFKDFKVKTLKRETEKEIREILVTSKKNVIIISDMYIKNTTSKNTDYYENDENTTIKKIKWLKNLNFELVFLDESHKGGTTQMAKEMMNYYGYKSTQVFISATYSKPINSYNIPKSEWILWDIEDIKLCRKFNTEALIKKHGQEIKLLIDKHGMENIITEYSKYPDLWILTDEINNENTDEIIQKTLTNNYGWSLESCFLPKQGVIENEIVLKEEFQNETEMLNVWYRIFGKKNKFNIPDQNFSDNKVFIKRIENICKTPPCSRFMSDGDFHKEPMIVMAFLPQKNIDIISKATVNLLKKHKVIPEYIILSINSKITNDPKKSIEDARNKARNENKKGVLVLSGRQCSLGVSIENCDIVLLLNNNTCFDMINQMMFRSMTEDKNKKYGFVVDLNIHRVIETSIINYATIIKPDLHPVEATKYILREKLINLNGDHWMPAFGNHKSNFDSLCNNLYKIYSSNTEKALSHFLNRLKFKEILFSVEDQNFLNNMFTFNTSKESTTRLITKEKIKKGIEKIKVTTNEKVSQEGEKNIINYMELIKHIVPLLCLITIHDNNTSLIEMFETIKNNYKLKNILINQTKTWWGKNINSDIIKIFIDIYIKYMKDDAETKQIIRTVKEIFSKNIGNNKELSKLIDKYLIPQELEKKSNAEVSTPYKLRQEMLDKIPVQFWTSPKKVFEPCAGKGGFVIDIIDRFMVNMKDYITDEKLRYKTIVQECLYFSDINPTNIFICKLLVDPYDKYKLNYNKGNTLELNIKEKWNIEGFDAVIGNPPYQEVSESGISKGGGNNLYTKFIYYADQIINQEGYLLYINPPTYFSPGRSNNKNNMNLRKDVLDKYYYYYINLEECAKHFNVGSKFIYYLIQKNSRKNTNVEIICKYNNKIYKTNLNQELIIRDYLPYLLTKECLNILNKVKNSNLDKLAIFNSTVFDKRRPYVFKKINKRESNEDYKIRALENGYIYPMQATSIQIVYSSKKCKNQSNKKVLMSRSGYLRPFYDNGIIGVGGDCFACLVKDENEGNKIIKLLNSRLYKFYIETNKWSGFHNKEVLKDLPDIIGKIDDITDENIYKYFGITREEIKIIDDCV